MGAETETETANTSNFYTGEIAITGVGVAHELSHDWAEFCERLSLGDTEIQSVEHLAISECSSKLASPITAIPNSKLIPQEKKLFCSQASKAALHCVEQALLQSGDPLEIFTKSADTHLAQTTPNNKATIMYPPDTRGVFVGSGFGNLIDLEPVFKTFYTKGPRRVSPTVIPVNMDQSIPSNISLFTNSKGVTRYLSSACASGLSAIFEAQNSIRLGHSEIAIAGGVDMCVSESIFNGWDKMKILSTETDPKIAQRPFDQNRKGLILGDGAAFFILEKLPKALERNAPILGVLKSCVQNSDAMDLVKPDPAQEAKCIQLALETAHLHPEDIHQIHAHGTGTTLNDAGEYKALRSIFQDSLDTTPINAIKAMTAHTMGASGTLSLAAALMSLQDQRIYPQPSFTEMEKLDQIANSSQPLIFTRSSKIKIQSTPFLDQQKQKGARNRLQSSTQKILINAFAFGGTNVCTIIESFNNSEQL